MTIEELEHRNAWIREDPATKEETAGIDIACQIAQVEGIKARAENGRDSYLASTAKSGIVDGRMVHTYLEYANEVMVCEYELKRLESEKKRLGLCEKSDADIEA